MARVIAFEVQIDGLNTAITNQQELTEAVKATKREFDQAKFGTDKFKELEKQLAQLRTLQKQFRDDVKDTARQQQIAADQGKGSYRALNNELALLRKKFKELSAAEREFGEGRGIQKRIQQLDGQLKSIDASIGQYQRNVGNYRDALAELGGIDLAALATGPGAILAIGTAAASVGKELFDTTEEVRKLRGEIEILTGATGSQLDNFTAQVLSLARSFDTTEGEIVQSANAVAKQFNIPFDQALGEIRRGFLEGSDITGEFLDILREYPGFFAEANIPAEQFFDLINQSVTGGVFSDKGIDAIKEATLRLRELPKATTDALEGIGISSEQIRAQIEEEGIGAAIATVSTRLGELEATSPEVGAAIAGIFGGAGEDAGLQLLRTLSSLNDQTGEAAERLRVYREQQERTLAANDALSAAQTELTNRIGDTNVFISNTITRLKALGIQGITFVFDQFQRLLTIFQPVGTALIRLGESLGIVNAQGRATGFALDLLNGFLAAGEIPLKILSAGLKLVIDGLTSVVNVGRDVLEFFGLLDENAAEAAASIGEQDQVQRSTAQSATEAANAIDRATASNNKFTASTKAAIVATDQFATGSIAALRKAVQDLRSELDAAAPGDQEGLLTRLIDAEAALQEAERFQRGLRERLAFGTPDAVAALGTTDITPQVQAGQTLQDRLLEQTKDRIQREVEAEEMAALSVEEIRSGVFQGVAQASEILADFTSARADRQIRDIEGFYNRELALAEGNTERQEALAEELAQKRTEAEEEAFEQQKRFRRAAILASLAEGIVNILAAPTTIPDPFGTIFKAGRIAFLSGTAALQLSQVNSQTAAKGTLIDWIKAASGTIVNGRLRGATHSDSTGGIPIRLNGTNILAEHGEFSDLDEFGGRAIINKRSSAAFAPQLRAINGKVFPGKRALLSAINNHRGFGIPLANQGIRVQPAIESITQSVGTAGPTLAELSDRSVSRIAAAFQDAQRRTANDIRTGARVGVSEGMNVSNRRAERQARLSQRTGI